ncbi:MAG: hypothetical protein HYS98_05685 [Deltaproteobacteria bacterium]|nr:hypothetical protein [Deltaproteobacteria bacterium]
MTEQIVKTFFLLYFFVYNSINLILILMSYFDIKFGIINRLVKQFDAQTIIPKLQGVSVIVSGKVDLSSLSQLQYPQFEVIVADNGDVRASLKQARFPYVCVIGDDVTLTQDSIFQMMKMILLKKRTVYAVSSLVGIGPAGRIILSNKIVLSRLNCLLEAPGVFIIERDAALKINESAGLSFFSLHRYLLENHISGDISYYPYMIATSKQAKTWKESLKSAIEEFQGLAQNLLRHRAMLFNPHYKQIGLIAYPYYFFFTFLGPILMFFGFVTLPIFYFFGSDFFSYFYSFMAITILYGFATWILSQLLNVLLRTDT